MFCKVSYEGKKKETMKNANPPYRKADHAPKEKIPCVKIQQSLPYTENWNLASVVGVLSYKRKPAWNEAREAGRPWLLKWSLFYVRGCFARMYVCIPHVCQVPKEARREHQISWDWSYRLLGVTTSVGTGNWTWALGKAVIALKPWVISSDSFYVTWIWWVP